MERQTKGKLNIKVAVYGLKIVTHNVIALIKDDDLQTLNFVVTNKGIGKEGWVHHDKSITVAYSYDDGPLLIATAKEGQILSIGKKEFDESNSAPQQTEINEENLSVLGATYGPADVTNTVKKMITPLKTLLFKADNTVFGDTWPGIKKTLIIIFGFGKHVTHVEMYIEGEEGHIDLKDFSLATYTVMIA